MSGLALIVVLPVLLVAGVLLAVALRRRWLVTAAVAAGVVAVATWVAARVLSHPGY